MRTALVELLLLAVAGGLLGAWIVLRRLAFFSHAVGTATFPGLVVAEAAGFGASSAGWRSRSASRAGCERAGGGVPGRGRRRHGLAAGGGARARRGAGERRVRVGRGAWTGCCSARCSGWTARDLALSAAPRRWRAGRGARARAAASPRSPSTREGAAAIAGRGARALDAALLAADRRWPRWPRCRRWARCSTASLFVVPGGHGAAARAAACRRCSRWPWRSPAAVGVGGLYLALWLDVPPGPGGGVARAPRSTRRSRPPAGAPADEPLVRPPG